MCRTLAFYLDEEFLESINSVSKKFSYENLKKGSSTNLMNLKNEEIYEYPMKVIIWVNYSLQKYLKGFSEL